MLSTGIRTPVGVKVIGTDLAEMETAGPADRAGGEGRAGHRQRLCRARHRRLLSRHRPRSCGARALRPDDRTVQDVIATALGGEDRHDHGRRARALWRHHALSARPAKRSAGHRARSAGADAVGRRGAARRGRKSRRARATSIRTENGQLAIYIFVDIRDRDLGGYVADAKRAVNASELSFRPAPTSCGAGSSSISNAPRHA